MPILNKEDKNEFKKYNDYIKTKDESYFAQDLDCYNKHELESYEGVYIEKNGNVTAAITFRIEKIGKKAVMLVADGGPVCDIYDVNTVNALINEAKLLEAKYRVIGIKIYPYHVKDEKIQSLYVKEKYKFEKNTSPRCVIKLAGKSLDEVMDEFTKKANYIIERAKKKNITIKAEITKRALDKFCELYKSRNVVKIEDVTRFEYYKTLIKNIEHEYVRVFSAYYGRKLICSAIVINYNKQVFCLDEEYIDSEYTDNARALMHMQIIEWALKSEAIRYDMGPFDNRNDETHRLMKGFLGNGEPSEYMGAVLVPMRGYYINKIGGICIGRNKRKTKGIWTRAFD